MVEECLPPPTGFVDGALVKCESLTHSREFDFPAPVGHMKVWNVDHEEAQLMLMYLGDKGLTQADFFVTMLKVAHTLGLHSREVIEFKGGRFSPREFLVSRLPRPVDLYGKLKG